MNRVLKQSLSLWATGMVIIGTAACFESFAWADRLNFYDGKIETGHITEISGDIVRYRKGWLHEFSTSRLKLTDRQDIVTIWGDKKITGEVHYIDGAKIELLTDAGSQVFWKAMVKDIQLGSPKLSPSRFAPASSLDTTPTQSSMFPNTNMDTQWTPEPQPSPNFSTPQSTDENSSKPRVVFPEN